MPNPNPTAAREALDEPFAIHHPGSAYKLTRISGEAWLCWQHPDGQWVTEQKMEGLSAALDRLAELERDREPPDAATDILNNAWDALRAMRDGTAYSWRQVDAHRNDIERALLALEQVGLDRARLEPPDAAFDPDNPDVEQLITQLAGCLCAAEGVGEPAKQGDYGWSPAYQAVLDLRARLEPPDAELVEWAGYAVKGMKNARLEYWIARAGRYILRAAGRE